MHFTRHAITGGEALRFTLKGGAVWALVWPEGAGAARIAIYEQDMALAARDHPEVILLHGSSPEERRAKNRFGTGQMLRVIREVRRAYPDVRFWLYDRVSGAAPGDAKVRC